jgi:hypothetical protein
MNFGIKNLAPTFALIAIFGCLQVIVTMDSSNAQTIEQIIEEIRQMSLDADVLIQRTLQEEQRYISSLSCQQLPSEINP